MRLNLQMRMLLIIELLFEDTDQFNQVKSLIANASGWDVVTISVITSSEYDTKLVVTIRLKCIRGDDKIECKSQLIE